MNKRTFIDICEEYGWRVNETEYEFELQQFSPAGEDFLFCVPKVNPVTEVWDYYISFDPEEHASMWCEARKTVKGVPGLRVLVEDADKIDRMLEKLAVRLFVEDGRRSNYAEA